MRTAILSIGDELLCGEVVDTNAARIGEELYRLGLKVQRHLTVGDSESDIVEAIRTLAARTDAVIVTGGLGPTGDDITAVAAARAASSPLVLNEEALAHVKRVAGKLGGEIHPSNDRQALIPQGAILIPNPLGTACGFHLCFNDCSFFFMPGVPVEMERMLQETVLPQLAARRREQLFLATRVFKVFGLSEAEVDARLAGVIPEGSGVTVAFGVDFPEIHLKLRAEGKDEASVQEALKAAGQQVRRLLEDFVIGENGDTIDTVVAARLAQDRADHLPCRVMHRRTAGEKDHRPPRQFGIFYRGCRYLQRFRQNQDAGRAARGHHGTRGGQCRDSPGHGFRRPEQFRQRPRTCHNGDCRPRRGQRDKAGWDSIPGTCDPHGVRSPGIPLLREQGGNQVHHRLHGSRLAAQASLFPLMPFSGFPAEP